MMYRPEDPSGRWDWLAIYWPIGILLIIVLCELGVK